MLIENISDTARWVATYRAQETGRPDAIFRDPFARRLRREHPLSWLWRLLRPITPAPRWEEIRWLASYVRLERVCPE